MSRYEVWRKGSWGRGGSVPVNTYATLDSAMDNAKSLSSSEVYFVLDKAQAPSKVRGFGINGKWHDAILDCKRCNNSGEDYSGNYNWKDDCTCTTCKGASWKPF